MGNLESKEKHYVHGGDFVQKVCNFFNSPRRRVNSRIELHTCCVYIALMLREEKRQRNPTVNERRFD